MAIRKIIWSFRTKNDLISILDFFIRRNGSKTYSIKLNENIRNSIRLIENHPYLGVQTDIENVRNLIHRDYEIFLEIKLTIIEILTKWDCRQKPSKLTIK